MERFEWELVWVFDPAIRNICLECHYHFAFHIGHFDILPQLSYSRLRSHFLHTPNFQTALDTNTNHSNPPKYVRHLTYRINQSAQVVSLLPEREKLSFVPDGWSLLSRLLSLIRLRQSALKALSDIVFRVLPVLAGQIVHRLPFL